MQLNIYRPLSWLLDPVITLGVSIRSWRKGASKTFQRQRCALEMPERPAGKVIWFHGASIGEIVSVMPIINDLCALPDTTVLVTSISQNAAEALPNRLPEKVLFQTLPIDTPTKMLRFFKHWSPSCGFLVESEIWPNLLYYAKKSQIPLALLNARMSERSYNNWSLICGLAGQPFSGITLCFAQDPRSATYFSNLGVHDIKNTGNLKTFAPPLHVDDAAFEELRTCFSGRCIWLAASTHEGEELLVAKAHQLIKLSVPNLLTIIVPRHPTRSVQIASMLQDWGTVSIRSKGETIDSETDFYLGDTFGELGTFYSLSKIALIGATLVPKGGHNPMEAARFGCAILHGPFTDKNRQIYKSLGSRKAAVQVETHQDMACWIKRFLDDEQLTDDFHANALALASKGEEAILQTLTIIKREFLR